MNKEKLTKEYFEKWKSLRLRDTSKVRLQRELLEYARFHAVSEDVRMGVENRSIGVPQNTSFITKLYTLRITRMTALILIALLVSGGTSFAAESALPGDALYPIKVEVNENVRSAFAISNKSEATLQTQLTERRLEEASLLAEQGKLDAQVSNEIGTRLAKHYNKAKEHSDKSETEGDIETSATVRASLEGSFRTYADVLAQLDTEIESNEGASLITEIKDYADASARAQATATITTSDDVKGHVEATVNRASVFIKNAEATLARVKEKLSAETYARFTAHLNAGIAAEAKAETQLKAEQYREAYGSAQIAIRLAQEIQTTINSAVHLEDEVETDDILENTIDLRINARVEHDRKIDEEESSKSGKDDDDSDDDSDEEEDDDKDENDDRDNDEDDDRNTGSDDDEDDRDEGTTIRIKSNTNVDTDAIEIEEESSVDTQISL